MNNFAVILGTAFIASTNAIKDQRPGLAQVAAKQDGTDVVYEEPVEEVAVDEAPVDPIEDVIEEPVEEAAVEEAPVEESAVEEAPVEETASTDESVEEEASLIVNDDSKVADEVLENATTEQTEYVATLAESVMETLMTSDMDGLNIISFVYSDETIDAASALMAQESIVAAANFYDELPGVCESGQECRDGIGATTNANVKSEWVIAFDNIRLELENAVLRSGVHIESGYNEAVMCDPGCGPDCSEVEIELANAYDEMVRIMGEIRALEEEQAIAIETITHIEEMCPAFADMTDAEIATYADEQMETYADAI